MAAFVQKANSAAHYTGTSLTLTLPGSVGAGNTLVLLSSSDTASFALTTVSGCGATWSQARSASFGGGVGELWTGVNATTGTTVTLDWAGSTFVDLIVAEFSSAAVLSTAVTTGSGTNPTTAAVTATASGQAAYGGVLHRNFGGAITSWTDTPAAFTDIANLRDATVQLNYAAGYRITTATGDHHRVGTSTDSAAWAGFGVLMGTAPPSVYRKPAITVRGGAVRRASVI